MSNSTNERKQKKSTFNGTWLKTYEGFEDYTEEEAEKIVEKLQQLANIVCEHVQKTGHGRTDQKGF